MFTSFDTIEKNGSYKERRQTFKDMIYLHRICDQCFNFFREKRFQFLVEWDPSALIHLDRLGNRVPLQNACIISIIKNTPVGIRIWNSLLSQEERNQSSFSQIQVISLSLSLSLLYPLPTCLQ
jgi:hypothetical protein